MNRKLDINRVPQEDGVSCGYCTTKAIYDFYGVSSYGLRHRLGTDHGFLLALPGRDAVEKFISNFRIGGYAYDDTIGTYTTDMLAVLKKDGFESECMPGFNATAKSLLIGHIRSGNPAIGLIGWRHWIVISGANSMGVWIVDSQYHKPYFRTCKWCSRNLTGFMPVRRSRKRSTMGIVDYAHEYVRGVVFVLKMACRQIAA